jgi:alpha-beta hydrolase superfamily lysophospholipase
MNFLLMRGLIREQRHWTDFPVLLEQRYPGSQIMMLDLPGTGTEHRRDCPATLADITADLRARFAAAGGTHGAPFVVIAISLGGMIALEWCARWPSDFSHAVVINTSAGDLSRLWERLDWKNYGTVFKSATTSDVEQRERAIIDMTINRKDFDREALVKRWAEYARERPVSRATLLSQMTAAARSKLSASKVPTLVLASKADRLVRSVCSERIAEKLSAPIFLHESAGHDLPFDDSPWVVERIAAWLGN